MRKLTAVLCALLLATAVASGQDDWASNGTDCALFSSYLPLGSESSPGHIYIPAGENLAFGLSAYLPGSWYLGFGFEGVQPGYRIEPNPVWNLAGAWTIADQGCFPGVWGIHTWIIPGGPSLPPGFTFSMQALIVPSITLTYAAPYAYSSGAIIVEYVGE